MPHSYKKLFDQLPSMEHSPTLYHKIMGRIQREQQRAMVARLSVLAVAFVSCGALNVLILRWTSMAMARSGFGQYLLALFTDTGAMLGVWNDVILSLAESIPAVEVSAALTTFLLFAWITTRIVRTFHATRHLYSNHYETS